MKNITFYTTAVLIFIALNGCCTKKYCTGMNELSMVALYNFAASDVDSVSIETFQITMNGPVRIDSSFMSAVPYSGSTNFMVSLSDQLEQDREYKITLGSKNAGNVYILSTFTACTESCNDCFPKGLMDDSYLALCIYQVNGQTQYYSDLRIEN